MSSPTPVANYWNDYDDNGTSFGVRVGVGVGVALGVALIVLLVGYWIRRKRARQFTEVFKQQQQQSQLNQGPPTGGYQPGVYQPPMYQPGYQARPDQGGISTGGTQSTYPPPTGEPMPPSYYEVNTSNTQPGTYPPPAHAPDNYNKV